MIDQNKLIREIHKKVIPYIARFYIKTGDTSELQSFLTTKFCTNVLTQVNLDRTYAEAKEYCVSSLKGWAKNYFRDHARSIKIPRNLHDIYKSIQSQIKKQPALGKLENRQRLLTELAICEATYLEAIAAYETKFHTFEPYMASMLNTDCSETNSMLATLDLDDLGHIDSAMHGECTPLELKSRMSKDGWETICLAIGLDEQTLFAELDSPKCTGEVSSESQSMVLCS